MKEVRFSKAELQRYSRHLILPEFNIEGQRKLKAARVLVVGAGGLGSPVLLYLAAAGIGCIGILDFDVVDVSNLQRQVLYNIDDIGKKKTDAATEHLSLLNPHVKLKKHDVYLNSSNALEILKNYDLVVDGTDNFPTRYLVNDACVILNKPYVYGAIFRFEGQVSVFNLSLADGSTSPNYRDLFPSPPPPEMVPNCAEAGVIGVLPGIIGSLQANEVIKVITGIGEPLAGQLFLIDASSFETRTLKLAKDPANHEVTELIDYDIFCGIRDGEQPDTLQEISVTDLVGLQKTGKEHLQIIDVREPYEYEIANIGGDLIPLGKIEGAAEKIDRSKKVIILCRTGIRSAKAIHILQDKYGYTNLFNLKGGLREWANTVDPEMAKY